MVALRKLVEEQKKASAGSALDVALRDVKEYASRKFDLNDDILHSKLIQLDNVARASNHPSQETYSYVLQRFIHNKGLPNVGMLVASLLSTKIEAGILERENKFLKSHPMAVTSTVAPPPQNTAWPTSAAPFTPQGLGYPFFGLNPAFAPPLTAAPAVRAPYSQRGRRQGGRPRCFRCSSESHFMRDCPKKE